MDDKTTVKLRLLQGRLGEVVYQLSRIHFSEFSLQENWQPAVNAYHCRDNISICVDLAGVEKSSIDVRVEPRRVWIRGQRQAPEPPNCAQDTLQVLAMEIDYGPFERELRLPVAVVPERTSAEQRNGLLWIYLPLQHHA